MGSAEDRAHAERLLYEYRRKLRLLETRKARRGDSLDPSTEFEIDELRLNVATLEALTQPEPSDAVKDAVRRNTEGDFDFTMLFLQGVKQNERLTRLEDQMTTVVQQQNAAQLWRLDTAERLEVSELARTYGQRRNFRLSVASLSLLAALAVAIWIVLARAGLL